MSAAASLPTPPAGPPGSHNGFMSGNFGGREEKAFDHIQDLQARAQDGYSPDQPVAKLLATAHESIKQAKFFVELRRPDLAYIDYLRAYEIAVNVIPRSGKQLDVDQAQERLYKQIQTQLSVLESQFMSIKNIIKNNNARSGVLPKGYQAAAQNGQARPLSQQDFAAKAPYPQSNAAYSSAHGNGLAMSSSGLKKTKPSVSPKPESLHSRAVSHGGMALNSPATSSSLGDRFARLRMQASNIDTTRPDSRASNHSMHSSPITMPSAVDYNGRSSFDTPSKPNLATGRPQGPRDMYNGGPILPAKLPLDTQWAASMPKEPSPTYSPARNMQTTGNIAPPRHSARSLASSDIRRSSASMSSASARAPNGLQQSGEYFPRNVADGAILGSAPRPRSIQTPKETRCSAERLFDYLPRFDVLLIDVRPRVEFDQGHIYSQNIICIEPISLHQGMSADQLLESLVLSPEHEQTLFEARNKYDLVIYYDGNTQSSSYLTRPANDHEAKLKYLHEALHDFSQEKPLREPPMLLVGGIDAWIDLVGNQALSTSNTLARAKPGRPIQRRPLATANGSVFRMPKRRPRDFAPLGQDEEREWREKARAESVSAAQPPIEDIEEDDPERDQQARDAIDSFNQRYEFDQRYPEPDLIDRHPDFMRSQMPGRAPPAPPAKVPDYPPAPSPSQYQQPPRRPVPAAPRMSYTGVSDRVVSQSTPTGKSDGMVPYIPPKLRAPNMMLPKTGLINFGVTCYMNSVVQALSATTPLSALFLRDDFRKMVQSNWKGSKGVMPDFFSNLIRSLWKGDVECIRPTSFKKFCGRLSSDWDGSKQQDAMEFLNFLVECLHQDLNVNHDRSVLKILEPHEEAAREALPKALASKREWARWIHRENSPINDLFGGQHMSTLRCLTCGFKSTSWEAFTSISVEIPISRPATLDQCFAQYCKEERLGNDESWRCPKCERHVETTKQLTITRAPQYLVVNFKRFSAFGYSRSKIHTVIDFPLRNFDLGPYMLPPPSERDMQIIAAKGSPQELAPEIAMTPPYSYNAYAVLRHIGSDMHQGHYITAAKDRVKKTWRIYNDTIIRDIDPENNPHDRLQNKEAYIVFYERTSPDTGRL